MTNYDEIHNKNLSEMAEFLNNVANDCTECCIDCNGSCLDCKERITQWLNQEVKPTLSEAERVILENIDKKYIYILRHKNNKLALYEKEPIRKNEGWWGIWIHLNGFNHLFQFIKCDDERGYSIQELLKGE